MGKHENPQRPAPIYRPAEAAQLPTRFPLPGPIKQNYKQAVTEGGKEPDQAATVADKEDLGDVIRAITDMSNELWEEFFNIPGLAEDSGRVDPEKFDGATRYAFVSAGNALDYAIRLVKEKGSAARIRKLRKELADEMRAAGMTGDPDGESPPPAAPGQVE
jgi:hypothetical protein